MDVIFTKIVADIRQLLEDNKKMRITEEEFIKGIRKQGRFIEQQYMDECMEADLDAGKKVMGRMKNPITGEIEEVSTTEVICQRCGRRWLWGIMPTDDTFLCPECIEEMRNQKAEEEAKLSQEEEEEEF